MWKYFVPVIIFVIIFLGFHSAFGIVLEGELIWGGESLPFSLMREEEKVGVMIRYSGESALRVFTDIETSEVILVDDLNRSYTEGRDELLMSTGFLLVLSQIFSFQDEWWWEEEVTFYGSTERINIPPFGESMLLKVSDTKTGVVWNRDLRPSLGELLEGILLSNGERGLGTTFWKELFSLPGLPVAHIIDGETVFRLFEIVDEHIVWDELIMREGYQYQEWSLFLAPLSD